MRVLGELAPPGSIPKLIFDDETHHVLGMEAVPEPHENWKAMLLAGNTNEKYAKRFGELLGTIHRESWRQRKLYQHLFEDRSYFETLRIEPYYEYSAQQDPRAAPFLGDLIAGNSKITWKRSCMAILALRTFSSIAISRCCWTTKSVIGAISAFDVGFAVSHFIGKGLAHTTVESWTPDDDVQYRLYVPIVSQLVDPFWEHYFCGSRERRLAGRLRRALRSPFNRLHPRSRDRPIPF